MAGKSKKTTKKVTKKPVKKAHKKPAKKPVKQVEVKAAEIQDEVVEVQTPEEFYLSSLAYRIRPLELLEAQAVIRLQRRRQRIKAIAGILFIVTLFTVGVVGLTHKSSLVPKSVASSVKFPVYYPDPKKLPQGYVLDIDSFSNPVKDGVSYTVNYDSNKKVVFSVQVKPSDNDLQTFNASYIPLRIDYKTNLGQAEIGAYHSQTLVSVPINNGPWIIITAPADINPSDLKQIILAIRKP